MSIGVNLRVTGYCRQGGRKYMEDFFSVAYQQTEDDKDLEYAFIGIYDGHGGVEAAAYAKEHLMESIIKHKSFWSEDDEEVLRAIKDGYIATHYAMWKEQEKWPRRAAGLPSTAGTTASVAFIRRGKIYVGHVGDSGIVLGYKPPNCDDWRSKPLTRDHKPENADEMIRIKKCGGKVISKGGVPRVVWNRPRIGHQGPVRRSTPIDEIPFLAVARSLGDLWSYNSRCNQFVVSPNPDCSVVTIDTSIHRCLIFGTDGLFNMLTPSMAVNIVYHTEKHNEYATLTDSQKSWMNPSKLLVEKALQRWRSTNIRADNTSVVTLMLDPPGPPRAQVLKDRMKNYPSSGMQILTRFKETSFSQDEKEVSDENEMSVINIDCTSNNGQISKTDLPVPLKISDSIITKESYNDDKSDINIENLTTSAKHDSNKTTNVEMNESTSDLSSDIGMKERYFDTEILDINDRCSNSDTNLTFPLVPETSLNSYPLKERNSVTKFRQSTSFDLKDSFNCNKIDKTQKENLDDSTNSVCESIQINEITSSSPVLCQEENYQSPITSHNLRSSSKPKIINDDDKKTDSKTQILKRKPLTSEDEPLRKSVRIDKAKKKMGSVALKENKRRHNPKLISNKMILRKKVLRKPILKKKLKYMLSSIKQGQNSNTLMKVNSKNDLNMANSRNALSQLNLSKPNKSNVRIKNQQSNNTMKKTVLITKSNIQNCSENMSGSKGMGSSKLTCRLRSSKSNEAKVIPNKSINDTSSENTSEENVSSKLNSGNKKIITPQRKSLRHSCQNSSFKVKQNEQYSTNFL